MMNPVTASYAAYTNPAAQPAIPRVAPKNSTALPEDTVTLKSTGDVDHDADSQ